MLSVSIKKAFLVGLAILLALSALAMCVAWLMHQNSLVFVAGLAIALLTAISVAMHEHDKTEKILIAKELAEQANVIKSHFLATMSHEMRTPLNAILGMGALLAETTQDERQSFYTQSILTAGDHLLALINDVLDVAKIEDGKLELEAIDYHLPQLVQQVIDVFSVKANQKGLALELAIDPQVPCYVRGDMGRVRQILFNLLSNALKFTAQGHVLVVLEVVTPPHGTPMCQLRVTDTGIGIAPDKQQVIFEKFKQSDHATTRQFGGTGLGLAICADLLALMGGSIRVQSVVGQGATFVATWPLLLAQNPAAVIAANKAQNIWLHFNNPRILVAEDSLTNQYVVQAMLEQWGCVVVCVPDGVAAVQMATEQAFDLVLMDCHMPHMDGYEASQALKAQQSQLPIVALTASAMRGDREKCLAHGMDDYLAKPIDKNALNKALQRWLPQNCITDSHVVACDITQLHHVQHLLGAKFATLLVHFTAQGESALKALQPPHCADHIYTHMHKLKAAAGQLGFMALAQLAAQLEHNTQPTEVQQQEFAAIWQQTLEHIDKLNNHNPEN